MPLVLVGVPVQRLRRPAHVQTDVPLRCRDVPGADRGDNRRVLVERVREPSRRLGRQLIAEPDLRSEILREGQQAQVTRTLPDQVVEQDVQFTVRAQIVALDRLSLPVEQLQQPIGDLGAVPGRSGRLAAIPSTASRSS